MAIAAGLVCARAAAQSPEASDWGYYGGDTFGQHYSELDQIHRGNVRWLEVAWTYRTGELGKGFAKRDRLSFEATPVLAFGMLYLATPTNIVIALDPETGKPRWRHDPKIDRSAPYGEAVSRGVTPWQDPDITRTGVCSRRIFEGTLDARLIALDAETGRPCGDFGSNGAVDLTHDSEDYFVTSPPAVFQDIVIVGSAISDNRATDGKQGVIRAFDARSGALRWSFDPAADAWAVMSVDPERGLVFVPTGSTSPGYYGGHRHGDNRYANSLLAIDALHGKLVWYRQLVHHDLWDLDLAAQPVLAELEAHGLPLYAVLQATKTGMLFGFDREDGQPIFPITERRVPVSLVPGESAWPTQPFPDTPLLISSEPIRPQDAWGVMFWDRAQCRELLARYRSEGAYTPPDTRGTIVLPSYAGGVNWGGISVDAQRQRVFAAVNQAPMVVTLMSREAMEHQAKSDQYPRAEFAAQAGTPYAMRREPLVSPWGMPCTAPPWGTLVSVDVRRNRIAWQVPLGSTEVMGPWFAPTREFGTPNMGGPIATAGDLVFVGAAMDSYLRAFDAESGRELWKHKLPAGGQATPMTYRAGRKHRQFVVIAAGGHGALKTPRGDYVVAFALPEK
jgi:quinoprotein glucose dehydrogenase